MPGNERPTLMQDIEEMVFDLDNPEEVSMNDWEATFLDSTIKLIEDGRLPSMTQVIKLRQIHAERYRQQR